MRKTGTKKLNKKNNFSIDNFGKVASSFGYERNSLNGVVEPGISKEAFINTTTTPAQFYSPELTPETWLLPKSRLEILKWVRVFFNLEPYIQSILVMHAQYPICDFTLQYKDKDTTDFFNRKLFNNPEFSWIDFLEQLSLSYWKFGESIIWGDWNPVQGTWNNFVLIDPSLVDYHENPLTGKIVMELIPTTELKQIVANSLKEGRSDLPAEYIQCVQENQQIPLDAEGTEPNYITGRKYSPPKAFMFVRKTDPGAVRGTPILQSLFKCVTGDTRVALLDGTNPTIKKLVDSGRKDFWVYGADKDGNIVPAKAECAAYIKDEETIEVLLDNGSKIRCTKDHPFFLRDMSKVEAKDLKEGDSLMSWPINLSNKVVSVTYTGKVEPVYCVANAGENHNFMICLDDGSGILSGNTLIYQDKIRLAQIAIADRFHLPLEIWSIGSYTGDPKTSLIPDDATLDEFRNLIQQATMQPPFSIYVPPYVKYEAVGVNGKLLSVYEDLGYVENQILVGLGVNKNLITGQGPSFPVSEDTRALTKKGLKYHWELTPEDYIASYNPETKELEWHQYAGKFVQHYKGKMVHFKNQNIDHLVTPEHNCWVNVKDYSNKGKYKDKVNKDGWGFRLAKDVPTKGTKFVTGVNWSGTEAPEYIVVDGKNIPIDTYLKLAAYYTSEGWAIKAWDGITYKYTGIGQSLRSDCLDDIQSVMDTLTGLGFSIKQKDYDCKAYYKKSHKKPGYHMMRSWVIKNNELSKKLYSECGIGSYNKCLPEWIKDLTKDKLQIVLSSLLLGDDSWHGPSGERNKDVGYNTYITTSTQLSEDVAEIALKLGYAPKIKQKVFSDMNLRAPVYNVNFSDKKYETRSISAASKGKNADKSFVDYDGYIWCINLPPHHTFICERNGRFVVTGNSSAKQVSLYKLIKMYKIFRQKLEAFIKRYILLPISRANDLKDEFGNYIIPDIVWSESLQPEQDKEIFDSLSKLWDKGIISTLTLMENFMKPLDYNLEQKRLESEKGTVFDKGNDRLGNKAKRDDLKSPSDRNSTSPSSGGDRATEDGGGYPGTENDDKSYLEPPLSGNESSEESPVTPEEAPEQ